MTAMRDPELAINDPDFDPNRCTWEEAEASMLGFGSDYGLEDPDVVSMDLFRERKASASTVA